MTCYKCSEEFLTLDLILVAADGRASHYVYCPSEHRVWWAKFQREHMGRNT